MAETPDSSIGEVYEQLEMVQQKIKILDNKLSLFPKYEKIRDGLRNRLVEIWSNSAPDPFDVAKASAEATLSELKNEAKVNKGKSIELDNDEIYTLIAGAIRGAGSIMKNDKGKDDVVIRRTDLQQIKKSLGAKSLFTTVNLY